MKIGYARVSRVDQNLSMQTQALKMAGVEKIYADKISGAKKQRTGLDQLLEVLRPDDTVVVWRLDRLARSVRHLIDLSTDFEDRGVQLISLTENIDTTTPSGKFFFHVFASLAEFERNIIRERTYAGLDAARARGRLGDRRPVLTPEKKRVIEMQIKSAKESNLELDCHAIGRSVGASERTIRRYLAGEYETGLDNPAVPRRLHANDEK